MNNQIFDSQSQLIEFVNESSTKLGELEKAKISQFRLSYSKTRTLHSRLHDRFLKCFKETQDSLKTDPSMLTLTLSAQKFVEELQKSNLYKEVNLFIYPQFKAQGDIGLHFEILDRHNYFLQASNELELKGVMFSVKGGHKNITGREDAIQFEYEKCISRQRADWSLQWTYKTLQDNFLDVRLKQSDSQPMDYLEETNQEISVDFRSKAFNVSLSNNLRSNVVHRDQSIQNYHCFDDYMKNFYSLPSKQWVVAFQRTLHERITTFNNLQEGTSSRLALSAGLPYLSTSPFVKFQINHVYHRPLEDYRKRLKFIKEAIKNAQLSVALSYGAIYSKLLMPNDMFTNFQLRSFDTLYRMHQSEHRKTDSFAKFDCKLAFQNNKSFQAKNISLFYYLNAFTLGQPNQLIKNLRGSVGVGIAMPMGPSINIEALMPLYTWRKNYDKGQTFQIRISVDD